MVDVFVKAVQTAKVSHPTQRSFDLKTWNETFAAVREPTIADVRLYESGIWTFRKLEAIRQKLSNIWVKLSSKREHLLMFVAGSNRDCHLLGAMGASLDPETLLVMEQVIQATVDQPYGLGPSSPDAMLLSSVDSLRFPLQMIYSTKTSPSHELQDLEMLARIRLAANLGQLYSIIEGYWMHAVWNGWYVDSKTKNDSDLIRPPSDIRSLVTAISNYRREALTLEAMLHLSRVWKYDLTDEQKDCLVSRFPSVSIVGEGPQRRIIASARDKNDNEAMMFLEKGMQAERGFYLPLVNEPLNKLGTVTLHMLLQAWEVLYALAVQMMETFPRTEDSGVDTIAKLFRYAPTVNKHELKDLIATWCNFKEDVTETIIDFFSYGPNDKRELWAHPLIKINNEELLPLMAPIRYGNIERTFELWMKASGLKLGDKGPLFENYARAELSQSLSRSELLKNAAVHPTKVMLRSDGGYEEIDIVIQVQDTILIGEAKCLLFPSEPIEVSRYFTVLDEARSQILRKADFARRNLPILAKQLGIPNSKGLIVEPFILVNQPFGAGSPQGEVPVTDELILKRFFDGKWHRLAMYNENELETHSTFILYQNEVEASSTVSTYLKNPPQLRHYRQNIKASIQRYPAIDENDRPMATVHLEVVLPLPNLDLGTNQTES